MTKRVVSLILCTALILLALGAPAMAAGKPRVAGVDYSRLWLPGNDGYRMDVVIGNKVFPGVFERELAMTEEEVDALLRKVLRDLNMTEGTLMRCNNDIEKAKQIKDFDFDKAVSLLCQLSGADTIVDLVGLVFGWGDKSSEQVAQSYAGNKAAGKAAQKAAQKAGGRLAAKAATKLGGFAISLLINAGKVGKDELSAYMDRKTDIGNALEAARLLEIFYEEAQYRIAEEDRNRGGSWRIAIDSKHTDYDVSFFGVEGNTQTWHVWGTLKRERSVANKTNDPSGTYTGDFNIEVTHNLGSFDTHFFEKVLKGSIFLNEFIRYTEWITPILAADAGLSYSPPAYSFAFTPAEASELSKLYHKGEMKVEVNMMPEVFQQIEIPFLLRDMNEDNTFHVRHQLTCLPEINVWSSGHMSAGSLTANMDLKYDFKGVFREPTVPAIDVGNITSSFSASMFGQSSSSTNVYDGDSADYKASEQYMTLGEDPQILRDLRGRTYFLLYGGGK